MKKTTVILFLSILTLTSCNGDILKKNYYPNSTGIGMLPMNGKVQAYDVERNVRLVDEFVFINPFDTPLTQINRYSTSSKFDDIKSLMEDNYYTLHAYFDSHYDYKINDVLINNLKTINDHYGDGEFIEVNEDLYTILENAVNVTKASKGIYNVAVGSLSDLWQEYINYNQGTNAEDDYRALDMYGEEYDSLFSFDINHNDENNHLHKAILINRGNDVHTMYFQLSLEHNNESVNYYVGVDDDGMVDGFVSYDSSNDYVLKEFLDNGDLLYGYMLGDEISFFNDDINQQLMESLDYAVNYYFSNAERIVPKCLPTEEEIICAKSAVPNADEIEQIVELKKENDQYYVRLNSLQGASQDVRLSLGSIGKGYATKRMRELLPDDTIGLINDGASSVTLMNDNPWGNWSLAITNPLCQDKISNGQSAEEITDMNYSDLLLKKQGSFSFSTSGDYNKFYIVDNVRYHHIIDPNTGYPSQNFRTVSVACSDSTYADALTTGLMALSLEDGIKFVKEMRELYNLTIYPIWTTEKDGKLITYADKSLENNLSITPTNPNGVTSNNDVVTSVEFIEV